MTNTEAITAALRDLLGPDVTWHEFDRRWEYGLMEFYTDGYVGIYGGAATLSSATLDKLHAASQIIRRMVQE